MNKKSFSKKMMSLFLSALIIMMSLITGVVAVSAETPAAYIGTTPYSTLAEALTAANSSATDVTITLNDNVSSAVVIDNAAGKTITLDLNGKVLTAVCSNNIYLSSDFILTDSKVTSGTGKYTCDYENAILNNYKIGSVLYGGAVTIRNAVVENTCTSVDTAAIVYWPTGDFKAYVEGSNSKIIFDADHCSYTRSTANMFISGGCYFSADPSAYIDLSAYDVNTHTESGKTYYSVTSKPVIYNWIDYKDPSGVTIAGNTYTVTSAEGLAYIAYLTNSGAETFSGKTVVLANDIDLSTDNRYWTPIGTKSRPFKGTFDGGNHKINDLNIANNNDYNGLFGKASNATFKNVEIVNASVSGRMSTAVLVGSNSVGSISNITISGDFCIYGGGWTGLIAGYYYGDFTSCNVIGNGSKSIDGGNGKNGYFTGGIVGYWGAGNMKDCHVSDIKIEADHGIGGLVGNAEGDNRNTVAYSSVENVELVSTKSYGNSFCGGLIGIANGDIANVDVTKSYIKDSVLPDDMNHTGYIIGFGASDRDVSGIDACYMNVTSTNPSLTDKSLSVMTCQGEAAATNYDNNAYGFTYYISDAAAISAGKFASLESACEDAADGDTIVMQGNIDEFLSHPIEVSKNLTIEFGKYYNAEKEYVFPGKGYKMDTITADNGDVTVVISEITYAVTFVTENGNPIDVQHYTVKNPTITEPEVPAKEGYLCQWEEYSLNFKNIIVKPVYTENAFGVKLNVTNCTTDGENKAFVGNDYKAVFTPINSGYNRPFDVTITVGGVVLDESMYTYDTVTGELVIKAEAITGPIEITATSYSIGDSAVVWTKNEAKAYYVINETETVYTHTVSHYKTGSDVTFKVVLLPAYDKSEITVFVNGFAIAPNADGSYTIHNVEGGNLVLVSGIIKNKTSNGIKTGFSILDWLLKFFEKIINFFKGM